MPNTHSADFEKTTGDQYLSAADSASLSITGDMTMEMWVKTESLPAAAAFYGILNKGDLGLDSTKSYWFAVQESGGQMVIWFQPADGTADPVSATSVSKISNATWTHIAISYSAAAGTCKFYINGAYLTGEDGSLLDTSLRDGTETLQIGGYIQSGALIGEFDGLIDEVRIWNDVRTATEISDNYQTELVGNEAGLAAYWQLDDSLLDETANNNDLTNNNSVVFSTDVPFGGATANHWLLMGV